MTTLPTIPSASGAAARTASEDAPRSTAAKSVLAFASRLAGVSRAFPVPDPYKDNQNMTKFLATNNISPNVGSCVAYAMYRVGKTLLDKGDLTITVDRTLPTAAENVKITAKHSDADVFGELNVGMVRTVADLLENTGEKAGKYLIELVTAQQTGSLDASNVSSYFKAAGYDISVNHVMAMLPYFASAFPKLNEGDWFNAARDEFKWLKYHTTVASGNGLVSKFLDATGTTVDNPGPFKIPHEVVGAVQWSMLNAHDPRASDAVPLTLKGITHVYLDALGQLPSKPWYQGLSGRQALSPAAITAISQYAVCSNKLRGNTEEIRSSTTINAMDAALMASGAVPPVRDVGMKLE